jgi:uncharacterized membrane protein SirB2
LPRKFLQTLSYVFQALRSVEYMCVLKSWSSNCCLVSGPTKIPSFLLTSIWEIFALRNQTLRFLYASLSRILLSNRALCAVEVNRFLTYTLKHDVPHSSDLVLFLNGVAIFVFFSVAVPGLTVSFTLAEFSVSALQHSQRSYNVLVSMYISTVCFRAFFSAKPEVSCTVLSCELHEPVR